MHFLNELYQNSNNFPKLCTYVTCNPTDLVKVCLQWFYLHCEILYSSLDKKHFKSSNDIEAEWKYSLLITCYNVSFTVDIFTHKTSKGHKSNIKLCVWVYLYSLPSHWVLLPLSECLLAQLVER